jgi:molybdate transport system regulatory protein
MATAREQKRRAPRRTAAAPSAKTAAPVTLWIRVTLGGSGQIGPGKIDLLRKIREHRSISAAARDMGMSYRRAWLLVDELNGVFARPLVVKWLGGRSRGGASLTPTGAKLVATYDALVARAASANRKLLDELASLRRG